jgi:hypothetical protein
MDSSGVVYGLLESRAVLCVGWAQDVVDWAGMCSQMESIDCSVMFNR